MNALECAERIARTSLISSNLKYCLMDKNKLPYQITGLPARSNDSSTFVDFEQIITCPKLESYQSLAVSVQASKICAVDIDHCLEKENDFSTMSDIAKDILNMFKDFGYVESSFSGLGIRILFRQPCVSDYKKNYYLKNSKINVEYYQFDQPGRYVSLTGNCYIDNNIDCDEDHSDVIVAFLEKYMKRPFQIDLNNNVTYKDERTVDDLMKKVKYLYLTNSSFQSLWFDHAPGHGSNESERDYRLVAELYENVTKDPNKILDIFKRSKFYLSKDNEHTYKFNRDNNKYFWYLYNVINSSK